MGMRRSGYEQEQWVSNRSSSIHTPQRLAPARLQMEERPSLTPPCSTSPSGSLLLSSPPRAPSFESAFGSSIFAIGTVCRRTSGLSISVTAFGASGLLEVAMVVSSSIQMQETPTPFLRCLPQLIERPYRPLGAKEEIKNHTQHGRLEAPDRSKLRPPRQHHNGRPKQIHPRQHHPQSSQWQKNTYIPQYPISRHTGSWSNSDQRRRREPCATIAACSTLAGPILQASGSATFYWLSSPSFWFGGCSGSTSIRSIYI
jgi:hypothetical protein